MVRCKTHFLIPRDLILTILISRDLILNDYFLGMKYTQKNTDEKVMLEMVLYLEKLS